MKTFDINLGNGIIATLTETKRGQLKKFTSSLLNKEYRSYWFKVEEINDVKKLLKLADDKNCNRGRWYAHCNMYMFDLVYTKVDGERMMSLNTYYRNEKR